MIETELLRSPMLGLVPPAKEVSFTSPTAEKESDLMSIVERWPDAPSFFLAVYHHTILAEEMRPHSIPAIGETRYKSDTSFPDPIALLSVLARAKTKNELFTAVMVAPQLATAALAQQIAAIANLSHGRFSFGAGVGWNMSEYDALGMGHRFKNRGTFLNQQIPALEMMLTGKTVSLEIGEDEKIDRMSINPGTNYNVPIWIGGLSDAALQRAAFYGDGWMPLGNKEPFMELKPKILKLLEKNRRDPSKFGFMGRVTLGTKTTEEAVKDFLAWIDAGVTHIALTTTNAEAPNPDPAHHRALIGQFLTETRWIRDPHDGNFGEIFGHKLFDVPSGTLNMLNNKNYKCFKLKHERQRVDQFLARYNFETAPVQTNITFKIPALSESDLRVTQIVCNSAKEDIWFLETCDEAHETCILYDSKFDFLRSTKK